MKMMRWLPNYHITEINRYYKVAQSCCTDVSRKLTMKHTTSTYIPVPVVKLCTTYMIAILYDVSINPFMGTIFGSAMPLWFIS